MIDQGWYRKTLAIMILVTTAFLLAALLVLKLDNKPAEPIQIKHSTKILVIKEIDYRTKTVVKETDPYQWEFFTITGYTANDINQGTNNITYTGFDLEQIGQLPIVAVDPQVIPLYSIIEIKNVGAFVCLDTGGRIKGNRIDILFEDISQARKWGTQERLVRVIQ